jgi:hypothetical protein
MPGDCSPHRPRLAPVLLLLLVPLAPLAGCGFFGAGSGSQATPTSSARDILRVTSPAFEDGAPIPTRFSCKGENISPPLKWTGVPEGARSLALIVDDPDAPSGTYTHWVVYGIDPGTSSIGADEVPPGALQAQNSAGRPTYTGPCPPSGTHHYRFTVYVLRSPLTIPAGAEKDRVVDAITAKATAKGTLTGTFAAT